MALIPLGPVPPRLWRQMVLRAKGITQRMIAERAGEAESTVSRVVAGTYCDATLRGLARRDRVRRVIAQMVGVPVEEFFPEDNEGERPRRPRRRRRRK